MKPHVQIFQLGFILGAVSLNLSFSAKAATLSVPASKPVIFGLQHPAANGSGNVQNMGVVADAVILSSCSIGAGQMTLFCPTAQFTFGDVGKLIDVSGAGYTVGINTGNVVTTIGSFVDSNDVVLSSRAMTASPLATVLYCTDNTAAVQAAVNQTQGTLNFPAGRYCIAGQVTLNGTTATTALTGEGMENSIIYQIGPVFQSSGTIFPATDTLFISSSNYSVTNLGFSGTNWSGIPRTCCGTPAPSLIENYGPANNGVFTGDAFNSSWGLGWQGWPIGGMASNIILSYDQSEFNGADGLNPNINNSTMTYNTLLNNTQGGIEAAGSNNFIAYNTCARNATSCVTVGGGDAAGHNLITQNTASGNFNGIVVSANSSYDEVSFNQVGSNDSIGIVVESGGRTYVHDNSVHDNGCISLPLCNIQAPQNNRLSSNHGIYASTSYNTIANNTMGNNGVNGFQQKYGFIEENSCNANSITGNHAIGDALWDYYFKGSTNNYFTDPLQGQDRVNLGTATFVKTPLP